MKCFYFSSYNLNILQLNVAMWGPLLLVLWCSVPVVVMRLLLTLLKCFNLKFLNCC